MMSSKFHLYESQETPNTLTSFDFTAISEMDPSIGKSLPFWNLRKIIFLAEGYKVIYDREISCHLRYFELKKQCKIAIFQE